MTAWNSSSLGARAAPGRRCLLFCDFRVAGAVAVIAGGLGTSLWPHPGVFLGSGVMSALVIVVFRRRLCEQWRSALFTAGVSVLLCGTVAVRLAPELRPLQSAVPPEEVVAFTAHCADDLRPASDAVRRLVVRLTEVETGRRWRGSADGTLTLLWNGERYLPIGGVGATSSALPLRGDRVRVRAPFPAAGDAVLWVDDRDITVYPRERKARDLRSRSRAAVYRRLARVPTAGRSLAVALLLGDRGEVDHRRVDRVRAAGAAHVIALSGMHLAVLAVVLRAGFRRLLPPKPATVLTTLGLAAYVFVAGMIPSLLRALALVVVTAGDLLWDRRRPTELLLAHAVIVLALLVPAVLSSPGFHLSILALVGLVCLSSRFGRLLCEVLPSGVATYAGTTAAAMALTVPYALVHFGTMYPVGLVSAGAIAFLGTAVMAAAAAVVVTAYLPVVGTVSIAALRVITALFDGAIGLAAAVPAVDLRHDGGVAQLLWWCTLLAAPPVAAWLRRTRRHRRFESALEDLGERQLDY